MNTTNLWLAIPLVLSQLAGIAGFILGIVNYKHAKYQPKLEDQRKYRAELRECLFPVEDELSSIRMKLRFDRPLPQDLPPCIANAEKKATELSHVLESNSGRAEALFLKNELMNVRYSYSELIRMLAIVDLEQPLAETERRRYQSAHASLSDHIDRSCQVIDRAIKKTVDLDNIPQFDWRFWRRWKLTRVQ